MRWVKVKWIDPLFRAVDRLFPNRLHAQDGTIGDTAHATGTSGHNPDDTPGVQAERQDADAVPEVRACDVDARGVDGDAVVRAIVSRDNPDRRKLIYVIWNGHIWRADNNWVREVYTGKDPHDKHIHFSGNPNSDDDGSEWTSLNYGDDDMTPAQETKLDILQSTLSRIDGRLTTILYNLDENQWDGQEKHEKNQLKSQLLELQNLTSPAGTLSVGRATVDIDLQVRQV